MLYLGPEVLTSHFTTGSLLVSDGMALLGPSGVKWVFLAHEGLAVTMISLSQGGSVTVSNLAINGLGDIVSITPTGSPGLVYMSPGTCHVSGLGIDDVSLKNMQADGAAVKQWQQPI